MTEEKRIGIVMATFLEAKPFIKNYKMEKIEEAPFNIYFGSGILLILSGIGKALSAVAASYIIEKYKFKKLLNIGAAGSVVGGFKLGDVIHINRILESDRPSLIGRKERFVEPDTLKGFRMDSLSTQDRAIVSKESRMRISQYVSLVDMEGAAFIQACHLFKIKGYLFKIITDTPEHNSDVEIIKNIKTTRESLYNYFDRNVLQLF